MIHNKKKPHISVVVTTYNRKLFLKETIESILAQTFTDFELIVVDNYSDYDFIEYMKSINDSRIKAYQNENNGIIAINRNFGIKKAEGEYIAFCDDDDLWMSEKLEKQLKFFKENEIIGVGSQSVFFGESKISNYKVSNNNIEIDFNIALSKKTVPLSSLIIRNVNLQFDEEESLKFVEDKDFQIQLIIKTNLKILLLSDKLIKYRLHDNYGVLTSRKLNNINIYRKYQNMLDDNFFNKLVAKAYLQAAIVELRDNSNKKFSRKYVKIISQQQGSLNIKSRAIIIYLISFLPRKFVLLLFKLFYSLRNKIFNRALIFTI